MARDDAVYRDQVRAKYNGIASIWGAADPWHAWSHRQISAIMASVRASFAKAGSDALVVDVGSAGETYGLAPGRRIDIDIAERHLAGAGWRLCANAEALPLRDQISDLTICVGPVINYCSLDEALSELARITKPGGRLVLHVELSNSWEFVGREGYRADAAFIETFYKGTEAMWVYSDAFVRRLACTNGLRLRSVRYFHLMSSLIYRLSGRPEAGARVAWTDALLRWAPGIGQVADSAIYVFRREG